MGKRRGAEIFRATKRRRTSRLVQHPDEISTSTLVQLPDEILEMVLFRLDSIPDVVSFSLTSSKWYHLVHSTSFWSVCGKRFTLFRSSCLGEVFWRYLVPSSSWKKTKLDIAHMFGLPFKKGKKNVNGVHIRVKGSNGMLCIFQSVKEVYIVNPMYPSLKEHLVLKKGFPANSKGKLFFDFDSLSNNYTLVIPSHSDFLFCYYQSAIRKWREWTILVRDHQNIMRKSFMLLGHFFYFLKRSKEEEFSLELWECDLSSTENYMRQKLNFKKLNFIELESNETKTLMQEFSTFFLFGNNKKLMLLRASFVMLQVWSIHEEKDEYILKLHSTFQLDEEHKGCEILSMSDIIILQFCDPSSALAYCPSTREWQWIDDLHTKLGFGVAPSYYALEMSKAFSNKLTKEARC